MKDETGRANGESSINKPVGSLQQAAQSMGIASWMISPVVAKCRGEHMMISSTVCCIFTDNAMKEGDAVKIERQLFGTL